MLMVQLLTLSKIHSLSLPQLERTLYLEKNSIKKDLMMLLDILN